MKRGFTLIEMSVVLLVIAIVTHLSMRQLGTLRDQKLVTAANRQLEEIRASVFDAGETGEPTGFLADMGRLVVAANGTLSELWQMPGGTRPFAVRPASKANLAEGAPQELAKDSVYVATGWRGPYLRLPIGKRRLMDPWGNPMENPDAAGYDRLSLSEGETAVGVTHFGPTALSNDVCRQTLSLVPSGGVQSRLFVRVISRGGEDKGTVEYRWYGPRSGWITGGVTNASYGTVAVFAGLTPGRRVIWDSVTSSARLVRIRPGDNQFEIEVP